MQIGVVTAELGPRVRAGFTTRAGGGSAAPYDELNLALHVGDEPGRVVDNRRRLAGWAGAPVHFARQVHGRGVLVVDPPDTDSPLSWDGPDADAVVAVRPGVAVGVLVADCVPVLMADAEAGVAAAVHAGRKGFVAGVVEATIASMTARGAEPRRIRAAVGPAAGGCCYEVPEAMRDEVGGLRPATPGSTRRGAPSLDLRAGCAQALREAGVADVALVGGCTIDDAALFSYRRSAVTGRFAGVVRIEP